MAFLALLFGSVLVVQVFDRNSHSASDTIRPFVITVALPSVVAVATAVVLLRRPSK